MAKTTKKVSKKAGKEATKASKKSGAKRASKKARFELDAALAALPADAAQAPPPVPVAALVQEAKDVAKAAAAVKKLRKLPFDHDLLDTLPDRAAALSEAESAWRAVRRKVVGKASDAKRAEAVALRTEVTSAARYLLREDVQAQARVDDILEGDGIEDLIADLQECARLAREHEGALEAADVEGGIGRAADRADALAAELAEALAVERNDAAAIEALAHRNRCAALVTRALDEVRAAARYALRHDPEALRPFRSAYLERKERARRAQRARAAAPAPEA